MPELRYTTVRVHHPDCPLGVNGMRAYWEACEALADTPPQFRSTPEDAAAWHQACQELVLSHTCTCGLEGVTSD